MARSHDQGFVAVAPAKVYAVLAEPSSYPSWWATGGSVARIEGERDGIGLHLVFGEGSLEWYLEPFDDGTIINAFLDIQGPERAAGRRLRRARRKLHSGLVGLKKMLEARP
jgi:hypothetical protein